MRDPSGRVFWTTPHLSSARARELQDFCDALKREDKNTHVWTYANGRDTTDENGVRWFWFYAWGESAPRLPEGW